MNNLALYPENNRYNVIAIDPPWRFQTWSHLGKSRSPENHYPVMTMDDLYQLDIKRLANPNCALLMWAIDPLLPEAIALANWWGFKYKTVAFTWLKSNPKTVDRFVELYQPANWFMGQGYYTRGNPEMCLLFTHGKPKKINADVRQTIITPYRRKFLRVNRDLTPQLIVSPRREHSRKPEEFFTHVERLFAPPYLEVFARQRRPGWDAIGNEIDGRDIRDVLKKESIDQQEETRA